MKQFLNKQHVCFVGLLETKVKENKRQRKLGLKWTWSCNYSHSHRGRIWIGWCSEDINVQILNVEEQFMHCSISERDTQRTILCTVIYGLNTVGQRQELWRQLSTLGVQGIPWLVVVRRFQCSSCY